VSKSTCYKRALRIATPVVLGWCATNTMAAIETASPLFEHRNSSQVEHLDKGTGVQYHGLKTLDGGVEYSQAFGLAMGGSAEDLLEEALVWNPISGGVSGCFFSGCAFSGCFGSACGVSGCFGSVCAASVCGGTSGCAASVCGASACGFSICGGSVCAFSACGGSVCAGSGCSCPTPEQPRESDPIVVTLPALRDWFGVNGNNIFANYIVATSIADSSTEHLF